MSKEINEFIRDVCSVGWNVKSEVRRKLNIILKAQKQNYKKEILEQKKQLAKEMAKEGVKAEIESYNKAKKELREKVERMNVGTLGGSIIIPRKDINQLLK